MTLVIVVGTGIRGDTGWTNVCFCTVIRPDDVAAMACIWSDTQAVAAPMPRAGSVWLDAVCLVPNWTSRRIVALIRAGSTSRSRARSPGSGTCPMASSPVLASADPASAVPVIRGAATAVTAEADRNARRPRGVEAARGRTSSFSMSVFWTRYQHHGQVSPVFAGPAGSAAWSGAGQGGGGALDHLGEDRLGGGEVEPEGSGAAVAEGGSVDHRDVGTLRHQFAG